MHVNMIISESAVKIIKRNVRPLQLDYWFPINFLIIEKNIFRLYKVMIYITIFILTGVLFLQKVSINFDIFLLVFIINLIIKLYSNIR